MLRGSLDMLFLCIFFFYHHHSDICFCLSAHASERLAHLECDNIPHHAWDKPRCLAVSKNPALLPQGRERRPGSQGFSSYKRGGKEVKHTGRAILGCCCHWLTGGTTADPWRSCRFLDAYSDLSLHVITRPGFQGHRTQVKWLL